MDCTTFADPALINETDRLAACVTHTPDPPTATPLGSAASGIVLMESGLAVSTRETLPSMTLPIQTAPIPAAIGPGPCPTGTRACRLPPSRLTRPTALLPISVRDDSFEWRSTTM